MWLLVFCYTVALPALAANCYNPDGSDAKDGIPCDNGDNTMCCPDKWQCLSNGICHYEPDDTWGRYSCTGQSWGQGCPEHCNRTVSEQGNEAILQCADGTWCCDTNHPERPPTNGKSCCEADDASAFFDFGDASVIAKIVGGKAVATSAAVLMISTTGSQPSDVESPTSTLASISAPASAITTSTGAGEMIAGPPLQQSRSSTSVSTSTPSSTTQSTSVLDDSVSSSVVSPSATPGVAPPQTTRPSNTDKIVGIAVAVPISIVALVVVSWLLFTKTKRGRSSTPSNNNEQPDLGTGRSETIGYGGGGPLPAKGDQTSTITASEIDSREVRIPISPQDDGNFSPLSGHFPRDDTSNTLYPNARPNYGSYASARLPTSSTSTPLTDHAQDYSEWAVTPHLRNQRWSEVPRYQATGPSIAGSDRGRDEDYGVRQVQELADRLRIPSTIAELP